MAKRTRMEKVSGDQHSNTIEEKYSPLPSTSQHSSSLPRFCILRSWHPLSVNKRARTLRESTNGKFSSGLWRILQHKFLKRASRPEKLVSLYMISPKPNFQGSCVAIFSSVLRKTSCLCSLSESSLSCQLTMDASS